MIHHALSEGLLLLRQRAGVSVILALALAVPIALAGVQQPPPTGSASCARQTALSPSIFEVEP